jgi:hypothetical protein
MVFLLASGLWFGPCAHAEENDKKSARMNIAYYYNSVSDVANRSDIEVSFNFWIQELFAGEAKKHDFEITSTKALLFDSIEEMKESFSRGEIDLIVAPPLLISKYFKREELDDGFVGVSLGKKPEKLILIIRNDKNIINLKDLHGKRLGMIENDDLTDMFLDTLVLKAFKKSYKKLGPPIQYKKKNNQLILDIFFGKLDAGVVYNSSFDIMAELNPDIKNQVKILAELPIKGKNFSYFRRDYPLTKDLTKVAMSFSGNSRGKVILEVFKTPELDYCKIEDLDVFDKLYKDYLQLKQHQKK